MFQIRRQTVQFSPGASIEVRNSNVWRKFGTQHFHKISSSSGSGLRTKAKEECQKVVLEVTHVVVNLGFLTNWKKFQVTSSQEIVCLETHRSLTMAFQLPNAKMKETRKWCRDFALRASNSKPVSLKELASVVSKVNACNETLKSFNQTYKWNMVHILHKIVNSVTLAHVQQIWKKNLENGAGHHRVWIILHAAGNNLCAGTTFVQSASTQRKMW